MKALVLAAGKGIRMLPHTNDKPKVLIEIDGKPFLYYILKNLENAGLKNIGIVVGYKKEKIKDFVKEYNFNVSLIEQKKLFGTGKAVLDAKQWIGEDDFIVLMGDNLYSVEDIKKMSVLDQDFMYIGAHKSETPEKYGVLETDKKDLIKIHEKPENPKTNLINSGIYKLTPEIFDYLMKIQKSPRGEYEITDAISHLANFKKVKVYELKGYWLDMSIKNDIEKINKEVKKLGL